MRPPVVPLWVYAVRRALIVVPEALGAVTVLFLVWTVTVASWGPSAAIAAYFGAAPPAFVECGTSGSQTSLCPNPAYQADAAFLGIGQPIYIQWALFTEHLFTLQWGWVGPVYEYPWAHAAEVAPTVGWALPYTLELAAAGLLLALALAFGLAGTLGIGASPGGRAWLWSASRFAVPVFLAAPLLLFGATVVLGAPDHYVSAAPWCPTGTTTFSELSGAWPGPSCFGLGGTYPAWISAGGYAGYGTSPTGFPTLDALLNGQPWMALDSALRLLLPGLVIGFYTGFTLLALAGRDRAGGPRARFPRAAGAPMARAAARRERGARVLSELPGALGAFVASLMVCEVEFDRFGLGSYAANALEAGGLDGLTVVLAIVFVLALLSLAILWAADVGAAYLDPRRRNGRPLPPQQFDYPSVGVTEPVGLARPTSGAGP